MASLTDIYRRLTEQLPLNDNVEPETCRSEPPPLDF
jgi:hypothetical protein